ncbi:transposase, partial [Deltaproteobacteria bacterium TL4]
NKNSQDVELTDYLKCLQGHILKTLKMIGTQIQISYFVYDGAFGNNECLQMVKGCGLSLISKLQCKSALWFPYKGDQKGKGGPKKYGNKVDYSNLPDEYLVETTLKEGIEEKTYQIELLHKGFPDPLNVTIIQRRRISDGKVAQVILYSNDLELSWENMIHYYRLRFKIEFTFRDAKQYWGLEDFMNINKTQVKNAANLSMFMVNFSRIIASQIQEPDSTSMLDLKAHFQGLFYLNQVLKIDPEIQKVISFEKLQKTMANIGRIHNSQNQPIIEDKTPLNHTTQNKENGVNDTKVIETEKKGTAVIEFAKIAKKSLSLVANCLKLVTRKAS